MKRLLSSVLIFSAIGAVFAQAPFTIVRPADGSKVREKVKILFPKNSVPDKGYIGIYVDGKFIEALVPPVEGDYLVYTLNTKERQIPDGTLSIEARLFGEGGDKPRIIDKSAINVEVANSSSINLPEGGLTLRYRFVPGTQYIYKLEQRVAQSSITEQQARLGGRPSQLPLESETLRLMYAVDNSYGNGDGLVRIQAIPPKGKDKMTFTMPDTGEKKTYYDYMMHSIYMRLKSTGAEVFSSIPTYFPLEGTAGESYREDLFAVFPLPVFPTDPVRPGRPWSSSFQIPRLDLDKKDETKSLVVRQEARGELVGVEWESGRPCAKIRHTFEAGLSGTAGGDIFQRMTGFSGMKIEETIWFALDKRIPVKMLREYTVDRKEEAPPPGAAGGANQGGGFAGNPGGPRPGGMQGSGGTGGSAAGDMAITQRGRRGPDGEGRQGGGPTSAGTSSGTPPGRGGAAGGGGQGNRVITRLRVQQIFTLEQ